MVASELSAPTDSAAGIAAATAAPAVSYEIGQYFKAQGQEGSLKHIIAHAILGAAVSAAGDNNALSGALSAGGSEAAAPLISQWLYQETDGSKLTAEQKDTVNAITSALGAATGVAVGGTVTDVARGSLNAQNAVENNFGVIPLPAPSPILPFHNSSSGMTREEQLLLGRTSSTDANEEVARELSKAASKAGRLIKATDGVVGTVICLFDSRCPSVSEASQSIWDDAMGNQNSGSSTDAEQKSTQGTAQSNRQSQAAAGAPMPPNPDDDKNRRNQHQQEREKQVKQQISEEISKVEDIVSYKGREAASNGGLRKALEDYAKTGEKVEVRNPSNHIQKARDNLRTLSKQEKRIKNSTLNIKPQNL
ncbi:VENN motif pre-toxin domain-containing protein [Kingella negevensis]|uniref:VENN motif pre-toxin domain-containing protein n=1 Tax=Kingella negevensis TaxID=1522312 RepID=UPI0025428CD2|nr:VENN motif pre-toxin domain-containing protein [Kingella negevensis]WII94319.1 VENN motif pre-toxin domain-containing protein [Kingella negevensis]